MKEANMHLFGKTPAAMLLAKEVSSDDKLRSKVMRHLSDYNHYVDVVSTISDRVVRTRALEGCMQCDLDVPENVKTLIINVKTAKRRQALITK